jgi:DNA-directed RNA polymerase specialized sigma24 family protein
VNLSDLRELITKLSPSWDTQRSMQPDFGSGLAGKEAAFVNPDTQAAQAAGRQAEVDQAFKWPGLMAAALNAVPGLPVMGAALRPTAAGARAPRRLDPTVLARAKQGDERAIEEVLQHIRPMVRSTGAKYGKLGEDAMQEANLIALRNIQNAPEDPAHFMSSLRKELQNVGREIEPLREAAPLARETRELLRRVDRFKQEYYQKYGVELAQDRVIKKMNLSEFERQALADAYASPALSRKIELDKPRFDDTAEGFHSVTSQHEDASRSMPAPEAEIAGQIPTPGDRLQQKDYRAAIAFAMRQARQEDPRRAGMWHAYESGKTEKEIATRFGVSQPAVNKAITAMRQRLADIARARYEGKELPPVRPQRKPGGGGGAAKPNVLPPDKRPKNPPIQGGSDVPAEEHPLSYIGYQEVPEGITGAPGFHMWNLGKDYPGHSKGSSVSAETLQKLGIPVPEVPPRSVGAAAYRDPAEDVQGWVDQYRRFLATGGPDKVADQEIVRQLQNPRQATAPAQGNTPAEMRILTHKNGPMYSYDEPASDGPWNMQGPMPWLSPSITLEGRPTINSTRLPMMEFREDITIPRRRLPGR